TKSTFTAPMPSINADAEITVAISDGEAATVRRPSRSSPSTDGCGAAVPASDSDSRAGAGRRARTPTINTNDRKKVAESTTKAGQPECASETRTPAAPVPKTVASTRPACEMELAAISPLRGTTTETSVVRAGLKNVLTADSANPSTNSSQTMSAD